MAEYEKKGYLNQDFRIFHLVDESQREFSYHYHDFYKLVIFIRGDVTYCIEGKSYELAPYDMVLVNAGEVHRPIVHSLRPYERIIIYISPQFLQSYRQADYDLGLCFEKVRKEQSNVLRMPSMKNSKLYQVCRELESSFKDTDYASGLYQNILFLEFMIQLNRAAVHDALDFTETAAANDKILNILSYINEHLTEDVSIDLLAEHFFISKYYLMHSFKEETGYTIGNYLSAKRLRYAKELISGGMPVTQACFECGFKNYSTFSRAYKKNFKVPPTQHIE
jgi:AraC-like DNA-binding protein